MSNPISVTRGLNVLFPESSTAIDVPQFTFLDGSLPPAEILATAQLEVEETDDACVPQPKCMSRAAVTQIEQLAEGCSGIFGTDTPSVERGLMDYRSNTNDDSRFGMAFETGSQARSTLAEAL